MTHRNLVTACLTDSWVLIDNQRPEHPTSAELSRLLALFSRRGVQPLHCDLGSCESWRPKSAIFGIFFFSFLWTSLLLTPLSITNLLKIMY